MRVAVWIMMAGVSCQAGVLDPTAFGVRFGASATSLDELYTQGEVLLRWDLFQTPADENRRWFATDLDWTAGALSGQGNSGLISTLGPILRFGQGDCRLTAEGGVSPTFISKRVFDEDDFGSHLQFTSHGGLSYRLGRRTSLSYRFQHMSNANIGRSNPGLNLHAFAIVIRL